MRTRTVCYATVQEVEQRVARKWLRGFGEDAEYEVKSVGWYAKLVEWPMAVFFGQEQPDLLAGDKVKITVEKV